MTRYFIRLALLLVIMLTGLFSGARLVLGYALAPLLPLTAFDDPACDGPCWQGIEVGVTNGTAVMDSLTERGYSYEIFPLLTPDGYDVHYKGGDEYGTVELERGVVEAVSVPSQFCVGRLLMRYGVPSSVELVDRGYGQLFTVNGVGMFSQGAVLTYPAEGVVAFVPIYDSGVTGHYQVTLVTPDVLAEFNSREGWGALLRHVRGACPAAPPKG